MGPHLRGDDGRWKRPDFCPSYKSGL